MADKSASSNFAREMKKFFLISALIGLCAVASAQDDVYMVKDTTLHTTDIIQPIEPAGVRGRRVATAEEKEYARMMAEEERDREQEQIDRNLPRIDDNGQVRTDDYYYMPWGWGGSDWRLHKGLNLNLGASVFANFGGGGRNGAGFTQDISLMYVTNLSKKATLAVGGYFNNMIWGGDNYTAAGINAVFSYRFNEHWSAYAFVQKAFTSNNYANLYTPYWGRYPYGGYPYYGFAGYGWGYPGYGSFGDYYGMSRRMMDRIGGGVRYEWGNHNFLEIQVEFDHMPNMNRNGYDHRRYDYPVM